MRHREESNKMEYCEVPRGSLLFCKLILKIKTFK